MPKAPRRKASEAYMAKLRDPRWQKKRLKVLERDEWACQRCQETTETLHVHHRRYIGGREPWEYDDRLLVTLCATCHEVETETWPEAIGILTELLKTHMWADEAHSIACDLHSSTFHRQGLGHPAFFSMLGKTLSDPALFNAMAERYFDSLKCRPKAATGEQEAAQE